jgi:DNA-binding NtrC family response regulator
MRISDVNMLRVSAHLPLPADCHGQLASALEMHGFSLIQEEANSHEAVLLALGHPREDDLTVVAQVSCDGRRRLIVALMNPATVTPQFARHLLTHGASEVLSWPDILADPANLCAKLRRWQAIDSIASSSLVRDNLVGTSPGWTLLLRRVVDVAQFTNGSVLLIGQSGTGKELLARLIHTLDSRATKRELVALDCNTLEPAVARRVFFGHEPETLGCNTDACAGAFALAHRGTLFLDNVDRLSVDMQHQLLRVLETHSFRRLDGNLPQEADFRLICASRRNLSDEVSKDTFCRDLYYRLAEWVCQVPALAERREDILPLARHLWAQLCPHLPKVEFTPLAVAWLQARDYPGNVPDLRRVVLRAAGRRVGHGLIGLADIAEDGCLDCGPMRTPWPDPQFRHAVERAVTLGFDPQDIGRAASELARQMVFGSNVSLPGATGRSGAPEDAPELPEANTDPAYPASTGWIQPVLRPPRKLVLRPAQTVSHADPMPSDASHLPQPIPRNNDQEQPQ